MSLLQKLTPPPMRQRGARDTAQSYSQLGTVATLARWRWRQHWFLLLVTLLGLVGVVVIVCTVPLLAAVMQTAALRSVLTAAPTSADITLRTNVSGLASQSVTDTYHFIGPRLESNLHAYLSGPPRLEVRTPDFQVLSPQVSGANEALALYGDSISAVSQHVVLLKGRLPQATQSSQDIEIVITPQMAALLHVDVGSVMSIDSSFYAQPAIASIVSRHQISTISLQLTLRIVGLFNVTPGDPFWHAEDFLPVLPQSDSDTTIHLSALTSDRAMLHTFDLIASSHHAGQVFFANFSELYWYYRLAPARISITQFDDLTRQLAASQAYILNNFNDPTIVYKYPYIAKVDLFGPVLGLPGEPGILETFHRHVLAAQVPAGILALQVIGLLLLLSSMMAMVLVDRQVEVIAMLRSRGASGFQVFSAFMSQSIGLSLLALVAGLPLTLVTLSFVSARLLSPAQQPAFGVISNAPLQALWNIRWYVLAAIVVTNAAMAFSLFRAARAHMLPAGRGAQAGRRPLWQRLNLDVVAIIVALTGYALSLYLITIGGLLDTQTQALIASPLALLAPIFLLLALLLVFLRLLPWLLSMASAVAARGKRAVALLALAQMARAPRQAIRMTLLLALALAFASFTLTLTASQNQRALDIAAYTVGADFSGDIATSNTITSLQAKTASYAALPGVSSASVGFSGTATARTGTAASFNIAEQLHAVDPATFAQTVTYTPQDSPHFLSPLLAQLAAQRGSAIRSGRIPAVVDTTTANSLNLHAGSLFYLQFNNSPSDTTRYAVIAIVPHIPTINMSSAGGIVVDYATFVAVEAKINPGIAFNYAWLRTSDEAAAVASVRAALATRMLRLENLNDRRALVDSMWSDPLTLNLLGLLAIGATVALFLALIANFLMSWLGVRSRLISYIVLRALGASPHEIAGVLLWEQGIIYVAALALGAAFGGLLAFTVVPNLVFSTVPAVGPLSELSAEQYYALQHNVPVQVILPLSLIVVFIALAAICALALSMMARVVLRPEMSSALRLDEEWRVDALTAEEVVLTHMKVEQPAARRRRSLMPSLVQLAFWRLRETWFLLLVAGVGMITAITIVCAVPLLSTITTTSGLHNVLNATPTTSDITIETVTQGLSSRVAQTVQQQVAPVFQQRLGAYLSQPASFSVSLTGFTLASGIHPVSPNGQQATLQLVGASLPPDAPHITLLQGRMPAVGRSEIETLLTPETARGLHVAIGSVLTLQGDFFTSPLSMFGGNSPSGRLKLRVVGLFAVLPTDAPFWHGADFQPVQQQQSNVATSLYTLLVPSDGLLTALDALATARMLIRYFRPKPIICAGIITWMLPVSP